ncbi:hypothetical protein [Microbacterium dextranolyticum]|uniref:Uncharacterized protein n=1 Tax=Microbacterium dextranolyticum TaxID=36806 RepID=A0A9W6M5Q7_9MICO|nr:hypothetical protein [Microbacterium dextranolyticum]MBM7463992.1 hypothetical protein [Microbacterium dextranolyticum]GLJ95071.1 hypothetical protein GCM10017591_11330 [Microbacterium dextranolyticum]
MPEETQDSPALAQNEATEDERLQGLVAQVRADLSGEDAATVETAVRRRLDDTGIDVDEELVRRLVEELSA